MARQAAQQFIHEQKAALVVEALLILPTANFANSHNIDSNTATISTMDDNTPSTEPDDSKGTKPPNSEHSGDQDGEPNETPDQNPTQHEQLSTNHEMVTTSNDGTSNLDTDEDDLPLSELKHKEEDNLSLSELKQRLSQGKPFFKTKSYELYKYKHKCLFKCLKCRHTESSLKHINIHFKNTHGYLVCDNCDKQCNTISALYHFVLGCISVPLMQDFTASPTI